MFIFSDGISEINAELCAIDLPRAICDSAGSSRGLEAIDVLAGPKSLNRDRNSVSRSFSILTHGHERDLD
jgi:hypothetical protein